MRIRIAPTSSLARSFDGEVTVPGDKSIAHRWLILASTARGSSRLVDLPGSLDVRSMASCLALVTGDARPALHAWAHNDAVIGEGHGSTWNLDSPDRDDPGLEVQGEGREGLVAPPRSLDCGNSGTAMRLLAGVMAAVPFSSELVGDASLSERPMERVADPLREMGATVRTLSGHAPLMVDGGGLHGIDYRVPVASAQVKSAILLAAMSADGATTVIEPVATRDHTERALTALGGPVEVEGSVVRIEPFQHEGFEARCPGDPSSAAFLVAAAGITGSALTIAGVGLNPTRLRFLEVLGRMGIHTQVEVRRTELGEPVGQIRVTPGGRVRSTTVKADELPLVIDEVPILALVAAHAASDSWFLGAGELRFKESDRLRAIVEGIAALGGLAAVEGEDLVLAGGGLAGGAAHAYGDHRMAMALAVGALAAQGPSEIDGMESAEVSFPGFTPTLSALGASIEVRSL
jgi:3-phosphoshikimate 1-carboxyvinyltransferase